jgi:hypothetical protein
MLKQYGVVIDEDVSNRQRSEVIESIEAMSGNRPF